MMQKYTMHVFTCKCVRVRSMRMGFFAQRFLSGGRPLHMQRFAENIPRFRRAGLPFTPVETHQRI